MHRYEPGAGPRREPLLVLTLLAGAVLAPLQQIHVGEATSLRKHVAAGVVFAWCWSAICSPSPPEPST